MSFKEYIKMDWPFMLIIATWNIFWIVYLIVKY